MTKKVIAFFLILACLIVSFPTIAMASSNPNTLSKSTILIEAETGQVLYEKNSDLKQYPASITKVLTAIVAIENNDLDEEVKVGEKVPYEIESGSSAIYLVPDEILTMEDLLYALMVESANDAAIAIAEHTSGTVKQFSQLMNEKAEEIGATHSNFANPHGLHDEKHYTTADDMALIMKEAIKNPLLLKLMTTNQYTIAETNKQQTRYLWTKNRLYRSEHSEFYYDDVIASKTGYTSVAGNTLVSAARKNGITLISIVLNADGVECYKDTINLFNYGFDNFTPSKLVGKNECISEHQINGAVNPLKIVTRGEVTYLEKKDATNGIESDIQISDNLPSSIKKGDKVGKAIYSLDQYKIAEVDLVAGNDVKSKASVRLDKFKEYATWVIPSLLLVYILIRLFVHVKNVQIRRQKIRRKYGLKYKNNVLKNRKTSKRNQYYKF